LLRIEWLLSRYSSATAMQRISRTQRARYRICDVHLVSQRQARKRILPLENY